MKADDGARRELARGTVELAVLSLLVDRPRYGWDLISTMNETTGGSPEVKEGTLYPILHRLEDAGYVATSWEAEGRGQPRKYYRITTDGKARLEVLRAEWHRLVEGMSRILEGGG